MQQPKSLEQAVKEEPVGFTLGPLCGANGQLINKQQARELLRSGNTVRVLHSSTDSVDEFFRLMGFEPTGENNAAGGMYLQSGEQRYLGHVRTLDTMPGFECMVEASFIAA